MSLDAAFATANTFAVVAVRRLRGAVRTKADGMRDATHEPHSVRSKEARLTVAFLVWPF